MGQMNAPLFDLDRTNMQVEVNSYKPGLGLAWPTLFPLKYTPKFDLQGISGDEGIPISADRVAFNTRAPKKTRKKVGRWSGHLGKISISRDKDEIEVNEYNDLKVIAAANPEDTASAQYLVDMVYDDIKFCNTGMDYRVEVDSMRIGSSGKQILSETIDGDMATQDTIDFNVPVANFIGVKSNKWDDAENADGIADIIRGQKIIKDKGGNKPMFAIIPQSAFDLLASQKLVARRLASAFMVATGIDAVTEVSLDSINAYMRKHNYPQLALIDPYVNIENKKGETSTVRPWNPNVVTLSPSLQLGWTYYKPVPIVNNTEAMQVQGSYYKTTVYSDVNPLSETTLAEAYVQPGLINRASLVFLNTMKTTWNNGDV